MCRVSMEMIQSMYSDEDPDENAKFLKYKYFRNEDRCEEEMY